MRSVEDKVSRGPHRAGGALGKPAPSKWDDAQKWLVNLSRGAEKSHPKSSPRNSNADDTRLIGPPVTDEPGSVEVVETKNVVTGPTYSTVRPICLRDMGTEMTPIASQEPSRAATPIRAVSPVSSGPSSPVSLGPDGAEGLNGGSTSERRHGESGQVGPTGEDGSKKMSPMEVEAMAWEEAERAKYTARFKREEVKIQAWENHQKRKAEMENRKVEVKAERLKSRAQEKYNSRIAATRRIAEEKRANAEAKLQEKAMKTSERADYIRRNGHLPSFFSFKLLHSFCW
ncbi:Remorin family protein [Striga hermonthica]|uniref:Remorin family protein n=1 Tax=Striga hermonthica TaxID=68872 RepID=A0A9N7MZ99_STRHE|nr:Remorin family protein [Striga hermonthica]